MYRKNDYFSKRENELTRKFLEDGYLISSVENIDALQLIQKKVVSIASEHLDDTDAMGLDYLNNIHKLIDLSRLNNFRLDILNKINDEKWFRLAYYSLAKSIIEIIVGNEIAMQMRVNLSIQLPGDASSLLPVHSDVWSGDSPFEVVIWLPLVDCYGTKSMYLLPPKETAELHQKGSNFVGRNSEELYQTIKQDVDWITISAGQVLVFNQNLPHGNRINSESESRWSMNCRVKSIFSPYAEKKLGEFFEPVTIRAATRLGMDFKFPDSQSHNQS